MSHEWRFLLIEDNDDIAEQVIEGVSTFVDAPDTATIMREPTFVNGINRLRQERFDLLILDLKDDQNQALPEHDVSAGVAIFEALKTIRFVPVVFYTAHAHKVRQFTTPFVRVVEKGEGLEKLGKEIRVAMSTGLPKLSLLVDDIQRQYMWGFVSEHWKQFEAEHHKTDLVYLLARRLASTVELGAAAMAQQLNNAIADQPVSHIDVHPMQIYVYPPVEQIQAGDILSGKIKGLIGTWIVLTPTCDLVQKKAEKILLARCISLTTTAEYISWAEDQTSKTNLRLLGNLLGDNRQTLATGPKVQADRYKYLPGTFFLEDSVVDFQDVFTAPANEVVALTRIACLDSPFAEALLARFSRYFSRLGTPDISTKAIFGRLENSLKISATPALEQQ
jgi:CheY-like chemotaxis protein